MAIEHKVFNINGIECNIVYYSETEASAGFFQETWTYRDKAGVQIRTL